MVVVVAGLVLGVATFAYGGDGTSAKAVRHVRNLRLGLIIGTCRVAAFAVNIGMFGLSLAEGAAILLRCEAGAARMGTFLRFRHG